MAELLKPDIEDRMKIQRTPWIEEDVLDFEEVYIDLGITKEGPMTSEEDTGPVTDYTKLFAENPESTEGGRKRRRLRKKILIKGDPGIGKSTLAAKMAYEWATSTWKMFSLVFFISMRVVKPEDPIENIIIDENIVPSVYATNYDRGKILQILQDYGEKCLLIFDDLDGQVTNEMVLRIFKDLALTNCHIVLTARPNAIAGIKKYFTTVCNVDGFSERDATEYVTKLLKNKDKIESVMDFTKENQSIGISEMWRYPTLLLFICILVNDGNLDLQCKTITLTNIYDKLLLCLYRRYVVKRGIVNDPKKRRETLLKLGKLAYEGLQKGRLLFSKKEIEERVGKEAFYYGIIIGYKDRYIVQDIDADFLVCFLHQSIQDYLAAMYITHELSHSQRRMEDLWPGVWDMETLAKFPLLFIFVVDLCINNQTANDKLYMSTLEIFNSHSLEVHGNLMGPSTLNFLFKVLDKCHHLKNLTFMNTRWSDNIETMFSFVEHIPSNVQTLVFKRCVFDNREYVDCHHGHRKPKLKDNTKFAVHCLECNIPGTGIEFLAKYGCIHTLLINIDHIIVANDDKLCGFYISFVCLLKCCLQSIKHLKIVATPTDKKEKPDILPLHEPIVESVLNCVPSDISELSGSLRGLESLDIDYEYNIPEIILIMIIEAIGDRTSLKSINITSGAWQSSTGYNKFDFYDVLLSKVSPKLEELTWSTTLTKLKTDDSSDPFTEFTCHQKPIAVPKNALPSIKQIDFSNNWIACKCHMSSTLQALNGHKHLKELKITHMWLPHLMPLLQRGCFPALETLDIKSQYELEAEDTEMGKEDQAGVCALAKLGQLNLSCLTGATLANKPIHQNLLKQFFISVRASLYLTKVDISGQNAGGCLYRLLVPEGLPVLEELIALNCQLLPVDMYRLGKAAKADLLPNVKGILLHENPRIAGYLSYLCIGTWPSLCTIAANNMTSWDVRCLVYSSRMPNIMPYLATIICDTADRELFHSHNSMLREKLINIVAADDSDNQDMGLSERFKNL